MKTSSTLMQIAESLTNAELCITPEIPNLFALDASLLAKISILESQNPSICHPWSEDPDIDDGVEENIANSIIVMASALRYNLTAYYAAIREHKISYHQKEVEF